MSEKNTRVKRWASDEGAKLKDMTLKEKWEYIWEYYKLFIIGGVILVLITINIVNYITNPPKKAFVTFAILSTYLPEEWTNAASERLNATIIPDPEREEVLFMSFFATQDDPQMFNLMGQKFAAMTATKELDLYLSTEADIPNLNESELIRDLREVLDDETISRLGDKVKYIDGVPFGINLDGNAFLKECGFMDMQMYLSVPIATDRTDNIRSTISEILK